MKITVFSIFVILFLSTCYAEDYYIIDVSGKIFNEDGSAFNMPVTVVIDTMKSFVDKGMIVPDLKEERITAANGTFTWRGQTETTAHIRVEKEGYYSTEVTADGFLKNEANAKDIVIYMIPKGTPAPLEYTERAFIPDTEDKKSNGKQCGWSFSKRWYYPVDEENVDVILGVNEKNQYYYRIKSPGGFVLFPGFLQFESNPKKVDNKIEYLHEAPETGYVEDFILDDYSPTERGEDFCYFRTPDGKYGKMMFHGAYFDYYIQPDGSRNLELGKTLHRSPVRPSTY